MANLIGDTFHTHRLARAGQTVCRAATNSFRCIEHAVRVVVTTPLRGRSFFLPQDLLFFVLLRYCTLRCDSSCTVDLFVCSFFLRVAMVNARLSREGTVKHDGKRLDPIQPQNGSWNRTFMPERGNSSEGQNRVFCRRYRTAESADETDS